jgi:hypothetical protein
MTARYGPEERSAGKPSTRPAAAASRTAGMIASGKGSAGNQVSAASVFSSGRAVSTEAT